MSHTDLHSIAPELVLCGMGILILLAEAFLPTLRRLFTPLALLAVVAAGHHSWAMPHGTSFSGMLEATTLTSALSIVVLISGFLSLLASEGYLRRHGLLSGEYHALFLWSIVGMMLMLRATELLAIFICLELLSLCLYALAAYQRQVAASTEAALKYFLMGAFVSAFVLLGLALLYGESGTTSIAALADALVTREASAPLATAGVLLLVAGFGFKMSLIPFHAWAPDTYQGAPSPFVAFLSVAPKAASALVLIRILGVVADGVLGPKWPTLVAILAIASMIGGNLLALVQRDVKRMLAYSGIAHMGYLLIALVTLGEGSARPVVFYLFAYALMNGGAFAIIAMLYSGDREGHPISELSGLGYRHPVLAMCLTVSMLSLGGLPPTAGFFGKYLVFLHAIQHGHLTLALIGVLASLVGIFYYLRVVYTLYMRPQAKTDNRGLVNAWGAVAAVLAAVGSLLFGIWPTRILEWLLG